MKYNNLMAFTPIFLSKEKLKIDTCSYLSRKYLLEFYRIF